jgi:DHA1 family inner membrane transport protein
VMPLSLVSLMLCVFGITTGEFVIAGILPDISADLGVSIPTAGLLVTAYAIGMVVGGPVLTALTVRYPRKPLILTLLIVTIAGNLVSAIAPYYAVLFVARIITSLVISTFFANAIVIAVSTVPPEKHASTVSKLVFGTNLAIVLGAPLGTFVGDSFGWRATFFTVAAICALGLLLTWRLVPAVASESTSAMAELKVVGNRNVQLAIAVTAIGNAGLLMVFTYLAPLLTDLSGVNPGLIAVMLLLFGVGAAVGSLLGGWLADRALMPWQIASLALLTAVLMVMWAASASTVISAVLVFVIGLVGFLGVPGMQTRVLKTATGAPRLALAVNASAWQLAAAFAGWLGGVVIDGSGLRTVYLVAAGVTALGMLVSVYSWRRDRTALPV